MVQRLASLEVAADIRPWDGVQRALDLLLVLGAAPLWAPLLGALLILKRLFDGGPVFFRHQRLGRAGRPFHLLKIRTTPNGFVPRPEDWPDEKYPPRTLYGRLLRRVDLDELPQLWNVLQGQMSLAGPRPETDYHASFFAATLPDYARRLSVRPGLSGLAQARGWRGDTSIEERLRCDLEYIQRRGAALYAAILGRTLILEIRRLLRAG